jgi:DNA gyrase subunit A
MRLSSLAHLEKIELENEHKELMDKIKHWKELLGSVELQRQVIQKRLAELVDKYGDARRTVLTQINPPSKEEKEIINVEPEKCVVIMTESGLIKRVPSSSFRVQKRNGAGVKTQDGITSAIIRTNTIDSLMVFTDKGRMYRILVDNIPSGTNASKGVPIKSLIEMESFENPTLIYSIYYDTDAKYIMFVTKNGTIKKTALEEYTKTKKKSGVAALNLREGDEIASVSLIKDEQVILLTEKGMGIKFKTSEVSASGRATMGVKGIALGEGDKVVTALPIRSNEDQLAIFSENGLGKRIKIDEFVTQSRGGKGIICYKPTSSTGNVVAGTLVADSDNLLVSGSTKSICIGANDISTVGRASIGVQIIKEGHITSVSKI